MLGIRGDANDALWRRITISKDVAIRCKRNDGLLQYRIEDIRSFVTLAAVASFIAEPRVARENSKTAGSVLQRYIQERGKQDYISEESFDSFSLYMTKNHAINIPMGNLLSLGGLTRCQEDAASSFVVASINFKIPYHTRHGWINLSSIQLLATSDFPPPLRSLINKCYEVRGYYCGIYVSIDSHLETLAGHLGLRYSCDEIVNQGDKGLEQYTWTNGWFILCPNESADLVPVESAQELVWGRDSLGRFLSTHMPHNPLDAKIKQDPRALLMAHVEPGSTYDGTLESSSDPLVFSFGREDRRDVRTSFEKASRWVETDASSTRQRRRQANMIRTDFHK
ncbi:hypothetical protein CSPX01_00098 [Colletotrichum filicis]|nr:hypothetical protein CSPX01_00098 [Colletotrichum filicis]